MNCGGWKYKSNRIVYNIALFFLINMVTYLVGTCHIDPKGPVRLKKFLNFVRPTSIGHESSGENAKKIFEDRRKKLGAFLQMNSVADPALKFAIMLGYIDGYELWTPYQHQQEDNPTTIIYPLENHQILEKASDYLQQSENNNKVLSDWETLLHEGLRTRDFKKVQNSVELAYYDSRIVENIQKNLGRTDYLLEDRDVLMEQKIREIVTKDAQGTTVAICGVGHLFGEYHNLYERVRDLSPCRIRLPEVDKF